MLTNFAYAITQGTNRKAGIAREGDFYRKADIAMVEMDTWKEPETLSEDTLQQVLKHCRGAD